MTNECGPEHDEERGGGRHAAQRSDLATQPLAFDREAVVNRAASLDRLFHEPFDQPRRGTAFIRLRRQRRALDRAQDGGLQRGIAFLEVQGDLGISDAPAHGLDQTDIDQPAEDEESEHAKRDDGGGGELEHFEAGGRRHEREQRPGDDDDGAAERQLQAPAVANPVNDLDELTATVGSTESVRHVDLLPEPRIHLGGAIGSALFATRYSTRPFRPRAATRPRRADTTRAPAGARPPRP